MGMTNVRRLKRFMFGVGDVVRKLRQQRNWTIDDLAQRAAINRMTVSAIERGANHTRSRLDAIARAFNLANASALDALLHEWAAKLAAPTALNAEVRAWLDRYEALRATLPPEEARAILRFVDDYVNFHLHRRPAPPGTGAPPAPPSPPATAATRRRGGSRRR